MDLEERKTNFKKVFKRLKEVCENTEKEDKNYEIFRDSAIQRFESLFRVIDKVGGVFVMFKLRLYLKNPIT